MSATLFLFGPPRIEIDGKTTLLNGTNTAVLALLALSPATQHQLPRSRIAGTIWPETEEEHARQLLSNTLYRLRRLLPKSSPYLRVDNDTVQLAEMEIDVVQFDSVRRAEDIPALMQAIDLYSGDLLEGHDPVWVLPQRAEYQAHYLDLLARTAVALEAANDLNAALLIANKWALTDPLNEQAHTVVMTLCLRLNRYGVAIQQYETLTQLLADELDVEPMPETQALYELITHERQKEGQADAQKPLPFVGRQAERSLLIQQLDLLPAQGGVIFVEGEPGMGKTRLLTELGSSARWRDIRVVWGVVAEREENAHYAPLPSAIKALAAKPWLEQATPKLTKSNRKVLSHWLPGLADESTVFERERPSTNPSPSLPLTFALQKLIRLLTDAAPTVMILDDLQWADERLWGVLPSVLELCAEQPLLCILAFRSQEARRDKTVWEGLTAVEIRFHPLHLRLQGLESADCAVLARHLGKTLSPEELMEQVQLSQGNPLYLREMLQSKQQRSISFEMALQQRLYNLSDRAQQALAAASVLGRSFSFSVWQLCIDAPIPLVELLRARMVSESETGVAFAHDLIRASVYNKLKVDEKRYWHGRAAKAIPSKNSNLGTIGWHFEKANVWPEAIRFYLKKALFAQQIDDLEVARTYCQRAVDGDGRLLDPATQLHLELLQLSLKHTSTWGEAEEARFAALEEKVTAVDEPELHLKLLLLKGEFLTTKGAVDEIDPLYDHILTLTTEMIDRVEEVKTVIQISHNISSHLRNPDKGLIIAKRAIELAKTLPNHPHLLVNAIFMQTLSYLYRRDLEDIMDNLTWAEQLIDAHPELDSLRVELLFYQAIWSQLSGDWEGAWQKQHELISIHRRQRNITGLLSALYNALNIAVFTCQFEDGVALGEELIETAVAHIDEMEGFYIYVYRAFALEAYTAAGMFEEANGLAGPLLEWATSEGQGHPKVRALTAVAVLRFDEKDYEASYQLMCQVMDAIAFEASASTRPYIMLAEVAHLTQRPQVAQDALKQAESKIKPGLVSANICHFHYVRYLIERNPRSLIQAYDVMLGCAERITDFRLRRTFIYRNQLHQDLFREMAKLPHFSKTSLSTKEAKKGQQGSEAHCIDIWWTLDGGAEDARILDEQGKIGQRHHRLRRLVSQAAVYGAIPTHADLAAALGVTTRTIERDSRQLQQAGTPLKTRGAV